METTGDTDRNRSPHPVSPARPVKAPEPGVWGVANTQRRASTAGSLVNPSGFADLRVRHLAAGAVLGEQTAGTLDLEHVLVTRCEDSERMSVLVQDRTGTVRVIEGTGVPAGPEVRGLVLLARGTRSTLYRLDKAGEVLAVRQGFGGAEQLSAEFQAALGLVPMVRPATVDGITVMQGSHPPDLGATFLLHGPGVDFTTIAAGCLFFATDLEMPAGVVWGFLWAPSNSGLTSEFGSLRAEDLSHNAGRIDDYASTLTIEGVSTGALGSSRTEAYERLRLVGDP